MSDLEELRQIVVELTEAVHSQSRHLERLAEQPPGLLDFAAEFAVIAAETAARLVRLKKLAPAADAA